MLDAIARMVALESGRINLETAPFNFRAFMSKTVTPFVRRAEEKGLQMRVTISKKMPARVRWDRTLLRQLLQNLLSNAIKFTKRGEVAVEVDPGSILDVIPEYARQATQHSPVETPSIFFSRYAIPASAFLAKNKRSFSRKSAKLDRLA